MKPLNQTCRDSRVSTAPVDFVMNLAALAGGRTENDALKLTDLNNSNGSSRFVEIRESFQDALFTDIANSGFGSFHQSRVLS